MSQETSNHALIEEASKLIENDDAVFFIGAGMVKGAYPDWTGLREKILEFFKDNNHKINENELSEYSVSEPLNYFEYFKGQNANLYLKFLKNTFIPAATSRNLRLSSLIRSKCTKFITTNYDLTIERECQQIIPGEFDIKFYPESYLFTNEGKREIIHLHGLIDDRMSVNIDDIVLHYSAYKKAYIEHGKILTNAIIHFLGAHNLIFVGTSFSEPIIQRVFQIFIEKTRKLKTSRYLLHPYSEDKNKDRYEDEERLRQYGVKTIRFERINERFEGLDRILEHLCNESPFPKATIYDVSENNLVGGIQ